MHLFGDFNVPNCTWIKENFSSTGSSTPSASLHEIEAIEVLTNICSYHNLYQANVVPNDRGVLLDLILSHDEPSVSYADDHLVPLDKNHPPLLTTVKFENRLYSSPPAQEYFYDFKNANYAAICECLGAMPWDDLLSDKSLDSMMNTFYDALYCVFELYVPLKKSSASKFPPWFPPELINLIILKKKAHKKYKTCNSRENYKDFSTLRSRCKILSQQCYTNYINFTESSIQSNIKSFWKFVKSKRTDSQLPNEMFLENNHTNSIPVIANLFAEYFASVYSTSSCNLPKQISVSNTNLSNYHISISDIYMKLSTLNVYKGPGPDSIPPSILKYCSFVLARPLYYIFNQSLLSGQFPAYWKLSYITPIYVR